MVAAAQAGRAAGPAPRFGQQSGPNGFRTLPVLKVPLGPSPNDPSTPLELQMEVMVPEGETVTLFPCLNPYLKVKNLVEHSIQIWMQTFQCIAGQGRAGQGTAV